MPPHDDCQREGLYDMMCVMPTSCFDAIHFLTIMSQHFILNHSFSIRRVNMNLLDKNFYYLLYPL